MFKFKQEILIPALVLLSIADAELAIFNGDVFPGIGIYTIALLSIISIIIFTETSVESKNILQSLILLILSRIISLSLPIENSQALVYGMMLPSVVLIIKSQNINLKELGINLKKIYIYLPMSVLLGSIIAIIEYRLLNRFNPFIVKFGLLDVSLLTFVVIVELIFMTIFQTRFEKVFGLKLSILLGGSIFGIMYQTYGLITFAFILGIFLAYIFQKTRSIIFIMLILTTTNIFSYFMFPYVGTLTMNSFPEITDMAGELVVILFILFLIFSIINYKRNKYISNTLDMCFNPLLLTSMIIIFLKILQYKNQI